MRFEARTGTGWHLRGLPVGLSYRLPGAGRGGGDADLEPCSHLSLFREIFQLARQEHT